MPPYHIINVSKKDMPLIEPKIRFEVKCSMYLKVFGSDLWPYDLLLHVHI